jgi:hypothetical protein
VGQMSPNEMVGGLLQGSMRQLGEMLAKDPILRAAEEALNANLLREVVPVDWTEIARALRTSHTRRCWMRQAATCWRSRRPHPRNTVHQTGVPFGRRFTALNLPVPPRLWPNQAGSWRLMAYLWSCRCWVMATRCM